MRGKDQGEGRGRAHGAGAHGPDWVGPGRAGSHRGPKPTTRTTTNRNPIANRNPKRDETNTRLTTTSDKEKMLQHDATPMTLRFCLHMTQTPITILL
jgi:hypothetical protein